MTHCKVWRETWIGGGALVWHNGVRICVGGRVVVEDQKMEGEDRDGTHGGRERETGWNKRLTIPSFS